MTDNNNDPPSPDQPKDTDPPAYMTAEQFNKAMSSWEKRVFAKLPKTPATEPETPEKDLSRTSRIEKELEETKILAKDLSKRLQERDARDRDTSLRRATEQAIRAHGIDADFAEHALAYLIDAKKAVRHDEDGNIIFQHNGVDYDLKDGAAAWAQTRDAKLYKKPTHTVGSGDTHIKGSSTQLDNFRSTGKLELRFRDDADKRFEASNPKSTLDIASKRLLNEVLVGTLGKRQ